MQLLEVRGERDDRRVRIHASGELDLATVPLVATCLDEHVRDSTDAVELDLSRVAFIDSTGVRLLLSAQAQARSEGWELTIVPSEAVRHVVGLLGLQRRLLAAQPDAAAAMRSAAA